jgi:hypothetical protein
MSEEYGGVVQYLIHPALRPALDQWLASRGLRVDLLPAEMQDEDDLPTYLIAPTEELMRRARDQG